jgi:hypothetical protein
VHDDYYYYKLVLLKDLPFSRKKKKRFARQLQANCNRREQMIFSLQQPDAEKGLST